MGGRLVYHSFLIHLIRECDNPEDVETELWHAGYDIGIKLYNEFFSRFNLPENIPTMKKYGKATWKIFTGDWPDELIYKKHENLFVARIKDCIFCRDLILPEKFQFHACEISAGIYTSALDLWLKEKKLPYTVTAHETKCRMMGDNFCELQIKFEKFEEQAE